MNAKTSEKKSEKRSRGGARPGAGRPPKPAGEVLDRQLYIRLTVADEAAIQKAAGDQPVSEWARGELLRAARRAV